MKHPIEVEKDDMQTLIRCMDKLMSKIPDVIDMIAHSESASKGAKRYIQGDIHAMLEILQKYKVQSHQIENTNRRARTQEVASYVVNKL